MNKDAPLHCQTRYSETPLPRDARPFSVLRLKVYPIGIPLTYFCVLWKNRKLLKSRPATHEPSARNSGFGEAFPHWEQLTSTRGGEKEDVDARWSVPELIPSILLWKDYRESWDPAIRFCLAARVLVVACYFSTDSVGK